MRELRAACALAQSPDARRRRFQPFVHLNVSMGVQRYVGLVEAYVLRVGNSAGGDKDVAPFQKRRSRRGGESQVHGTPGRAFHLRNLHVQTDINAVEREKLEKRIGDIFVLTGKQLWPALQNGDTATETDKCLSKFQANIAAA